MTLTHCSITLILANHTKLIFPIQAGSKLPMILTYETLHPKDALHLGTHIRKRDRYENATSFFSSALFYLFHRETLFHQFAFPAIPSSLLDNNSIPSKSNWNLRPEQQELLLWHSRLGHINMDWVQTLLDKTKSNHLKGIIQPSNNKCSHCQKPKCEACQYGKQKHRNPPLNTTKSRPELEGAISRDAAIPGHRVSCDILMSSTRGCLPHTFSKEQPDFQYTCGSLFVDHASRFVHIAPQFITTVAETISSKHKFKEYLDDYGVRVKE